MLIVSTCIYVSFFLFFPLSFLKRPLTFFLCSRSSPLASPAFFELPQLLIAPSWRSFFPARSARAVSAISLVRLPAPPFSTVLDPLSRLSASLSGQRLARPSLRLVPDHIVSFSASQRGVASTISLVSAPFSACVSRGP